MTRVVLDRDTGVVFAVRARRRRLELTWAAAGVRWRFDLPRVSARHLLLAIRKAYHGRRAVEASIPSSLGRMTLVVRPLPDGGISVTLARLGASATFPVCRDSAEAIRDELAEAIAIHEERERRERS